MTKIVENVVVKLLMVNGVEYVELRMAEMAEMGIGNKPCLDIRPSQDQINDRSISYAQLAKGNAPPNSSLIWIDNYLNLISRAISVLLINWTILNGKTNTWTHFDSKIQNFDFGTKTMTLKPKYYL